MAKKRTSSFRDFKIFKIKTFGENDTRTLAESIASKLSAGTIIELTGELGTGKTTFVKGLSKGLSSKSYVSSPSFSLQKIYRGKLPLYHIDLYRLTGRIDTDELFEPVSGEGVWAVEWAEKLPKNFIKNRNCVKVVFTHTGGNARKLTISTNVAKLFRTLREITRD